MATPKFVPKLENYAKLRDANFVTDYYVGEKTNISRSLFTQWRRGRVAKRTTIDKLAEFFNVPATYFYEDHSND